jgi:hypothetical protein
MIATLVVERRYLLRRKRSDDLVEAGVAAQGTQLGTTDTAGHLRGNGQLLQRLIFFTSPSVNDRGSFQQSLEVKVRCTPVSRGRGYNATQHRVSSSNPAAITGLPTIAQMR